MATPIILYRNLFRTSGAVITSSGADSGYSAEDIADHRAYKGWQGNVLTSPQWINVDVGASGANADSILVVNHNLVANAGQITVYADTVNPPLTTVQAAYSPTSDHADYKAFSAPGAKRYWRVEFTDPAAPFTSKPFAGEILLGMKLECPEYAAPDVDPYLDDVEAISNRSEGGHYLGAILRGVTRRGRIRLGGEAGVLRSWLTSDGFDFMRNHYRKLLPFGLVFDSADSELAPARWLKKPDSHRSPLASVGGIYLRFAFDLEVEEAMMEAA